MRSTKIAGYQKPRTLPYEERRQQIVNAAIGVFAEKGYHKATISHITRRAGVAQGTFYLYFQSKHNLFAALLDDYMDTVFQAFFIPGAEQINSAREIRGRFEKITKAAILLLRDNPERTRIFLLEGNAWDPRFLQVKQSYYNDLIKAAAQNLQTWMDKGLLRQADPIAIAHCVIGMIEHLTTQWLAGGLQEDFSAIVAEVVKFELYGILKDPKEAFGEKPV